MKRLITDPRWLRLWIFGAVMVAPLAVIAKTSLTSRYPYDPACPWGRLSNGKGMIHRCLSENEAAAIAGGTPKAEKTAKPETKAEPADKPVASLPQDVQVALGPIKAEEGDISIGRLDVPMDRYKSCVMDNGGLSGSKGEVIVKFLVRAEMERAEAASVKSSSGVTAKAAQCIADVVDRRKVGAPSAPMTGVELTFAISR